MRNDVVISGCRGTQGNGAIYVEPILLNIEGGIYVGTLLSVTLTEVVSERCGIGDIGRGGGSSGSRGS